MNNSRWQVAFFEVFPLLLFVAFLGFLALAVAGVWAQDLEAVVEKGDGKTETIRPGPGPFRPVCPCGCREDMKEFREKLAKIKSCVCPANLKGCTCAEDQARFAWLVPLTAMHTAITAVCMVLILARKR